MMMLLLLQSEVVGSTKLQSSLENSVAELQQSLKQRDVDSSKMSLEVQVSHRPQTHQGVFCIFSTGS